MSGLCLLPGAGKYARFLSSLRPLDCTKEGGTMRRLPPAPKPNDLAVAVWLQVRLFGDGSSR